MLFFLSSCLARVEKSGFMFDVYETSNISKNITSKQTIITNMGNPTIKSDLDGEETWIYLAEEIKHFLFFKPKVVSREILAMRFDEDSIVSDVWRLDLNSENEKIKFNQKQTEVESHKTNSIKAFFENIGQVRAF